MQIAKAKCLQLQATQNMDHYALRTSQTTNHLLSLQQHMEKWFKLFLFELCGGAQAGPHAVGLEAGGLHD